MEVKIVVISIKIIGTRKRIPINNPIISAGFEVDLVLFMIFMGYLLSVANQDVDGELRGAVARDSIEVHFILQKKRNCFLFIQIKKKYI